MMCILQNEISVNIIPESYEKFREKRGKRNV